MEYQVLNVKNRPLLGKRYARKIRVLHHIPGVMYGKGEGNVPLVINPKPLTDIINSPGGSNSILSIEFDDKDSSKNCLAMIQDFDVHPISKKLTHCDLLRINEDEELTIEIPIKIVGQSEGEKAGAQLNTPLRFITIKCKPADIPDSIDVDVTSLEVGDNVMLSELELPEGTTATYSMDSPVITVRMSRIEKELEEIEEAAAEEAAEAAEAAAEGEEVEEGAEAPAEGEEDKPAEEGKQETDSGGAKE